MIEQKMNQAKPYATTWRAWRLFAIVAIVSAFATFSAMAQESTQSANTVTAPVAPPISVAPQAAGGVLSAESMPVTPPSAPQSIPMQEIRVSPVAAPYNTSPTVAASAMPRAPAIVLIVPQKSEAYRSAAQALRTGFLAAAKAAQAEERCLVIEHEVGQVLYAFQEAQRLGAQVIVGPLVREDLRTLLYVPPEVWTIALTQLEDADTSMPNKILPLTLTIESDARLLARELLISGKTNNVALLSSETAMMKRFADAFIDEWLKMGEMPPQRIQYRAEAVAELRTQLGELAPSAVVLAVEGNDAALAYAQTKAWPTYASGHVYQRATQFEGFAFDRLHVVEIPWLIDNRAERFRALGAVPESPATARLYALGFDAFQVATSFLGGVPLSLNIQGASGYIRFDPKDGLLRSGHMAVFDGGSLRGLSNP